MLHLSDVIAGNYLEHLETQYTAHAKNFKATSYFARTFCRYTSSTSSGYHIHHQYQFLENGKKLLT